MPWPNEPTLDNFRYLFDERDVGHALRNSLFVSVSAMILATVLASLAGFALSRLRFRYKTYAVYAVLLLYAIPIAATMVAIYDLADRLDLIDTYYGLILAQTAMILPFLIWLMKGFYDGLPRYRMKRPLSTDAPPGGRGSISCCRSARPGWQSRPDSLSRRPGRKCCW